MAQYFELHPQNPQLRLIRRAAQIVREGGLIAYPTDSCYALGCHIGMRGRWSGCGISAAPTRITIHAGLPRPERDRTLCANRYLAIRMLKASTPGPFTFLLPATRETPRRLQHAKRRTIGIRVPITSCRACCSPSWVSR